MREILFRGKEIESDEWIFGSLLSGYLENGRTQILNHDNGDWEDVIPDTVGQFTGLTDKNGKKIFEGDFIQPPHNKHLICLIKSGNYKPCALERFNDSSESDLPEATGFYAETQGADQYFIGRNMVVKIIGNVFDNPELLGGSHENH